MTTMSLLFVLSLLSGQQTADVTVNQHFEAEIAAVKAEVESKLRDPFSAHWRNLRAFHNNDGSVIVCGEVNAKNAYGAYVGFEGFVHWNGSLTMPDATMPIVAPHQRRFVAMLCDGKP